MVQEPVWLWKIHQKNIALGQKKKRCRFDKASKK